MAAAGQETRGRASSDFVDDTILEAFVPAASQVNVQELLEAWDGEVLEDKNTIVPFIEQRPFLLLGTSAFSLFVPYLLLIQFEQMKKCLSTSFSELSYWTKLV
jgi:hypothetical protein